MNLVLATRNKKKVEEIQRIVEGSGLNVQTLDAYPDCPEVIEDGDTFQANAEKKAREVAAHTGALALADDSGLVVDALDGAPGVYSARYAGENASDRDNLEKLLVDMQGKAERAARFRCVLAIADASGNCRCFDGTVEGAIGDIAQGSNGFGYDPVFIPEGWQKTFAEMASADKDGMSHRGRALKLFSEALATARSQGKGLLD